MSLKNFDIYLSLEDQHNQKLDVDLNVKSSEEDFTSLLWWNDDLSTKVRKVFYPFINVNRWNLFEELFGQTINDNYNVNSEFLMNIDLSSEINDFINTDKVISFQIQISRNN